ncbi:MAG: type II toxin-antitoxin system Phd/YefM family antitoxin [Terriglobales bacterium]
MASWQVQDAKARFSEFLDTTIKKGPQVVARRGVKTGVMVPIKEWERLQETARPSLKVLPMDVPCFRECARSMHSKPPGLLQDARMAATARVHR